MHVYKFERNSACKFGRKKKSFCKYPRVWICIWLSTILKWLHPDIFTWEESNIQKEKHFRRWLLPKIWNLNLTELIQKGRKFVLSGHTLFLQLCVFSGSLNLDFWLCAVHLSDPPANFILKITKKKNYYTGTSCGKVFHRVNQQSQIYLLHQCDVFRVMLWSVIAGWVLHTEQWCVCGRVCVCDCCNVFTLVSPWTPDYCSPTSRP